MRIKSKDDIVHILMNMKPSELQQAADVIWSNFESRNNSVDRIKKQLDKIKQNIEEKFPQLF